MLPIFGDRKDWLLWEWKDRYLNYKYKLYTLFEIRHQLRQNDTLGTKTFASFSTKDPSPKKTSRTSVSPSTDRQGFESSSTRSTSTYYHTRIAALTTTNLCEIAEQKTSFGTETILQCHEQGDPLPSVSCRRRFLFFVFGQLFDSSHGSRSCRYSL